MGRHRKKTTPGRTSAWALSGLVPVSLVGAVSSTTLGAAPVQPVTDPVHDTSTAVLAAAGADPLHSVKQAAELVDHGPPPLPVSPPSPPLPTDLAASPVAVPVVNIDAYQAAERSVAAQNPNCHMPWTLVAVIGRVESAHANNGKADGAGELLAPIFGPILDGSLSGNNVIHDTDGGAMDGVSGYDRAVGPMQFLPETWNRYGADGNGDGVVDPQNLFDAALTTGKYLCDGGLDMRDLTQQNRAILRYNNSMAYVANVMAWELAYSTGVVPPPDSTPKI